MAKKLLKTLGVIAGAVTCVAAYDYYDRKKNNLHYSKILLDKEMQKTLDSVKRIDEDGYLYHMDYYGDYNKPIIRKTFEKFTVMAGGGCSAFLTRNENGEVITARNYDYPHHKKDKSITGLNIAVNLSPKGKYKSINFCDAMWLSKLGFTYENGCLDKEGIDLSPLILAPYLTMDGMNEKGLTCSILYLDIKKGEKAVKQNEKGKKSIIITSLLRNILDNCANIDEAIHYANSINLINTFGDDYHLFVSDNTGRSVVFEWRFNKFVVIETDACTNFYVCADDGEDCYYEEGLKEKFVANRETEKTYQFGYGHGYDRFNKIIAYLDKKTNITNIEARDLLKKVCQVYDGSLTSNTQYSVVYNNTRLEADVYSNRNYENKYSFEVINEKKQ